MKKVSDFILPLVPPIQNINVQITLEDDTKTECNICFETKRLNQCFFGCTLNVCKKCMFKMFEFNRNTEMVMYKCPQCRQISEAYDIAEDLTGVPFNGDGKKHDADTKFSQFVLKYPIQIISSINSNKNFR